MWTSTQPNQPNYTKTLPSRFVRRSFLRMLMCGVLTCGIFLVGCPQNSPPDSPPPDPTPSPMPPPPDKGCTPISIFPFSDNAAPSPFDQTQIGRGVITSNNRIALPYVSILQVMSGPGKAYRVGVRVNSEDTASWQDLVAIPENTLSSTDNASPILMKIQNKLHLFTHGTKPSEMNKKIFESTLLDSGSFSPLTEVSIVGNGMYNTGSTMILNKGADDRVILLYSYYNNGWKIGSSERLNPNDTWTIQALESSGYGTASTPFYVTYDQSNTVWAMVVEPGEILAVIHRVGGAWVKEGSVPLGAGSQPYNADFIWTQKNGVSGILAVWPNLDSGKFSIKTSFFDLNAKAFSVVDPLLTDTGGVNYPSISIAVDSNSNGKLLMVQQNSGNTGNQFWQGAIVKGAVAIPAPALSSVEVKSRANVFLDGCGVPSAVITTSAPGGSTDVRKAQLFTF